MKQYYIFNTDKSKRIVLCVAHTLNTVECGGREYGDSKGALKLLESSICHKIE
ncbi:hypothetical protein [uncultured Helicobacter sp.]|uniref:hypothetical protein n=1 Tax=uncultured Helicobacter sp. TaxID=175537 RepID=UPI00263A357A|nr:hypothetical protein [uncultured Helicobacter sp.]